MRTPSIRVQSTLFLLFLLFAIQFISPAAFAQPAQPAFIADSLDTYVEREMARWQVPGAAVCIVRGGEVVLARGYGVRQWGREEAVDANTLFMIGSNTKAFTGTAVAMLAEEGKCSLEDPVKKWVPEFTMVDPWVESHATLTDVLSHRMGMETFQGDFMVFDSDLTSEELIQKAGALKPAHPFRTSWGYFNTGFLIAGEAIERISGMSWADFMRQRFFEPLEMDRSLALSSEIHGADNRAAAHTLVDGKIRVIDYGQIDAIAPAGGISSSVNDMSHWLIAQLSRGMYGEKQVIRSGAIEATRKPYSIKDQAGNMYNRSNFSLYGLGWELQDYEGRKLVSHTGGIHGFVTSVTLLPGESLGIVVLTNTDKNAFYEALKWEILDAYLGLPYRGYSKRYHGFLNLQEIVKGNQLKAWRDSVSRGPAPPLPIKAYSGVYEHPVYGTATVHAEGESLEMTLEHHPKLKAKLQYLDQNRFLATFNSPTFGMQVFPFETEGEKVTAFTLTVPENIEKGSYHFTRKK